MTSSQRTGGQQRVNWRLLPTVALPAGPRVGRYNGPYAPFPGKDVD